MAKAKKSAKKKSSKRRKGAAKKSASPKRRKGAAKKSAKRRTTKKGAAKRRTGRKGARKGSAKRRSSKKSHGRKARKNPARKARGGKRHGKKRGARKGARAKRGMKWVTVGSHHTPSVDYAYSPSTNSPMGLGPFRPVAGRANPTGKRKARKGGAKRKHHAAGHAGHGARISRLEKSVAGIKREVTTI